MMPWGAEKILSVTERYKKTLEAGVNLIFGYGRSCKITGDGKSGMVDSAID